MTIQSYITRNNEEFTRRHKKLSHIHTTVTVHVHNNKHTVYMSRLGLLH